MSLPPGDQVPDIVIEPDADRLARTVAEALVARLAAAQAVVAEGTTTK